MVQFSSQLDGVPVQDSEQRVMVILDEYGMGFLESNHSSFRTCRISK